MLEVGNIVKSNQNHFGVLYEVLKTYRDGKVDLVTHDHEFGPNYYSNVDTKILEFVREKS